jgi:hypothetical protein
MRVFAAAATVDRGFTAVAVCGKRWFPAAVCFRDEQ